MTTKQCPHCGSHSLIYCPNMPTRCGKCMRVIEEKVKMSTIKAISLWEPWASLVRTGAKKWETRSWATNHRGPLLICAAKGGLPKAELREILQDGVIQEGLYHIKDWQRKKNNGMLSEWSISPYVHTSDLNFGKAVAIVEIIDCIKTDDIWMDVLGVQKHYGDFFPGRFAWRIEMIKNDFEPFPMRGRQGFFSVDLADLKLNQQVMK